MLNPYCFKISQKTILKIFEGKSWNCDFLRLLSFVHHLLFNVRKISHHKSNKYWSACVKFYLFLISRLMILSWIDQFEGWTFKSLREKYFPSSNLVFFADSIRHISRKNNRRHPATISHEPVCRMFIFQYQFANSTRRSGIKKDKFQNKLILIFIFV